MTGEAPGSRLQDEIAVTLHAGGLVVVTQAGAEVARFTRVVGLDRNASGEWVVATDKGIFHKMRMLAPDKVFIEAPTAGSGATCRSCAHCPWMAMNGLHNLLQVLETGENEIDVPIDSSLAPNFNLSAAVMERNRFHAASSEFRVAQKLNVTLSANADELTVSFPLSCSLLRQR